MTNLFHLCEKAGIPYRGTLADTEITSVITSPGKVCEGSLFIAVKGFVHDGEADIAFCLAHGAVAAVTEHIPDGADAARCIVVSNARRACACIFHAFAGSPGEHLKLIGVTGTNGKTSVVSMLTHLLESAGKRVGRIGTLGSVSCGNAVGIRTEIETANMTTPSPEELYRILAKMLADGCEYVIMEVSSHALALGRVAPLRFECGIFTNLTPEHLDFHGTMQNYAEAKSILFRQCRHGVVWDDDTYAEQILRVCEASPMCARALTCGKDGGADVRISDVKTGEKDVSYTVTYGGREYRAVCPVPGDFSVNNSAEALTAAMLCGMQTDDALHALAEFPGVPGRMEKVLLPDADFRVIIDYAHTPDALEKLLRNVRKTVKDGGRLMVLFGCGGDRDPSKRPEMGRIASALADHVIVTSDNSRRENPIEIIRSVLSGMDRNGSFLAIKDRREAIRYAVRCARAGDVLVLAGKGHELFEIDGSGRHPFDERAEVRAAYQRRKRNGKA